MTTSEPPRRPPVIADDHTLTPPEPLPGAPSRALRMRAADGWERFMRRVEAQRDTGT
ncbi:MULTISPECIES: hypothetical protein [unclassified Streptomyces]|uniref:hypothetical protein n=1 Tax=unclassified Streptomyces TaxID=2593676 RepID=UPI00225899A7|nr:MULTISPECIES: hypothetical protein [unclassified Streptomyces]MCX4394369.1 hypothetical protein [Streptomyces sp. NBC_01767]WSC28082.1 hypothetical protein OG902_15995 [Streptomyces sp. NBC_01768]